jgi:hypothetical protein
VDKEKIKNMLKIIANVAKFLHKHKVMECGEDEPTR